MPDRPGDMDERDVDARFASIVAQWEHSAVDEPDAVAPAGAPVTDEPPAAPEARHEGAAEDTALEDAAPKDADAGAADSGAADSGASDAGASDPTAPAPRDPWVNPSPLNLVVPASAWRTPDPQDAATERAAADADEALDAAIAAEEPHFEPPEVTLPPQEDLGFWGAVIGLVAGPLMLLYVVFARPFHSTRWFVASVVVSLLGFALLVLRQPAHRDPTSGDDGARV